MLRPCFSVMDSEGQSLIQRFRYILSIASLAYTFTILHAIQYSMQDHDDNDSTTQNPDLTQYSASSSTHDTPATTSTAGTAEKTTGRWTDQEIDLLLNYVEGNCILTTARGITLKKSDFNKAHDMVKTKDATQCHYKWGR
jgi:PKD repeat protein